MSDSTTLLDIVRAGEPQAPALVTPDGPTLAYGALARSIERLAETFQRAGLGRGDRIGIVLPNGVETIVAFLAAATAATAAPLNPAYTVDELAFYLADTGARGLVVPRGGGEEARRAAAPGTIVFEASIDASGEVQLETAAALAARGALDPAAGGDTALVLHTSGTTSRPKRVPLTQRNLCVSARNIAASYALGPEDASLCVMPLFHVHGLVGSLLATFASGGRVVVPARFNPLGFWSTVQSSRATWYSAVPSIHQMLLARAKDGSRPPGAEGLRFIRSCSSALAPATMAELEQRFGAPVVEAYGMTEASHQMASNPLPPRERKPGSVGCGTGVEIGIMNERGDLLPAGQQGEVVIRGANVTSGYEQNPEANAASFTHGWFRTGDEGVIDPAGYLRLIGRIKELIVRGGEKISPREVDEVLALHPAVAEVATFGVPHPIYGEEVQAAIALREPASEREIAAFCRERLAEFKCPKKIYVVEKIPRTATGKIQRKAVAAAIAGS